MYTYSCWADNSYSQFLSFPVQLPGLCFRDSFRDDSDRANLQMATPDLNKISKDLFFETIKLSAGGAYLWKLHGFKSGIVSRAKRGKVDHDIGIWMFVHGFGHVFVHCKNKPSKRSTILLQNNMRGSSSSLLIDCSFIQIPTNLESWFLCVHSKTFDGDFHCNKPM